MGGYDFQCQECHVTRNHKIAGRSSSVPPAEGAFSCERCHTDRPHYGNRILDHHLNKHTDTIECNTCHSPVYAKCKPTKVWWDWSKAGDKSRKAQKDAYGMGDYHWKKGEFRWKESAKPVYRWFGGYTRRVLIGDRIDPDAAVTPLVEPVGSMNDPNSKITPFKIMKGIQAVDARHDYFLVPHLFPRDKNDLTAYWKHRDWQKAFSDGMQAVGLPYSGEYEWVETWMYWRLHHEVMPAPMALSCVQCHQSLQAERTCNRCHQDSREVDFKSVATSGTDFRAMAAEGRDVEDLIGATDYIDFESLGYEGDPIIYGGRFKKLPMGYRASE
jgi:hypothetical protein